MYQNVFLRIAIACFIFSVVTYDVPVQVSLVVHIRVQILLIVYFALLLLPNEISDFDGGIQLACKLWDQSSKKEIPNAYVHIVPVLRTQQ